MGALHDNAVDSSDHPLLVEGKWTKDSEEKANLLNAHFATISSMPDPDAALPEEESYREDIPVLSDVEVTTEKVKTAIRRAKTRSASGPDDISNVMLKKCINTVSCLDFSGSVSLRV